jgi:hypothetical protein
VPEVNAWAPFRLAWFIKFSGHPGSGASRLAGSITVQHLSEPTYSLVIAKWVTHEFGDNRRNMRAHLCTH